MTVFIIDGEHGRRPYDVLREGDRWIVFADKKEQTWITVRADVRKAMGYNGGHDNP